MQMLFGTNNVLELTKKNNIKGFLLFSSSAVYGEENTEEVVTEDYCGCINPLTQYACYSEGKRAAETMCYSWYRQYGVPVKIIRIFHTFGPGMDLNDGRMYVELVKSVVNGDNIVLTSKGEAKRYLCYISDAVRAYFRILLLGSSGEAYNVANDEGYISVKEVSKMVANIYPEKHISVIYNLSEQNNISSKVKDMKVDVQKVRNLGWKPKVSVEEAFKRTIDSYIEGGNS